MEELPDEAVQRMSQFLTTEHFTLQGARNGTIAEANGRLGHYLSSVGSSVVALAFVANASQLEPLFLAFSAVIFPMLIVLGVATYIRVLQIGIHDTRLTQAINRIRHYYMEMVPEGEPYFSFPQYDDPAAGQLSMMPFHFPLQGLASTPGPVVLINCVLVGAFAGIMAAGFLSMQLIPAVLIALAALVLAFWLHMILGNRIWYRETREKLDVRFPTPEE
jgi:hypothetical protein